MYNSTDDPKMKGLAMVLRENWSFPMDFMFLDPAGQFVSKINSLDGFNTSEKSNQEYLLDHLEAHFPDWTDAEGR